MKKYISIILLVIAISGVTEGSDRARGYFLSIGVGPRMPISNFAERSVLGYGGNFELSFTDDKFLPFFIYGKLGYEIFAGSQEYYQLTEFTHYSIAHVPMGVGIRYYMSPLIQNMIPIMPVFEAGFSLNVFQEVHDYKGGLGKNNFLEDGIAPGFSFGVGVSAFALELIANYNYVKSNQFLSLDLKLRLPLFVSF